MTKTKAREQGQAIEIAKWMRQNPDLYRMVLRTALGLEQGTLSDAEHRMVRGSALPPS